MYWPDKIPEGVVCSEIVASMDFLPTFAAITGGNLPKDKIIDRKNISPLLFGEKDSRSPHEEFFYYMKDNLEAVRIDNWKLFVYRHDKEVKELYDLES